MDAAQRQRYWDDVQLFEYAVQQGAQSGLIDKSEAKRVLRMVESQPNSLFATGVMGSRDVIKDPSQLKALVQQVGALGAKEQQGANYAPRVEGHHPVSVSSTQAAGQHLPMRAHGQFIDGMYEGGMPVGTIAEHMYPFPKPAHTGNADVNVHFDLTKGVTDEGVWQGAFNGKSYGDDLEALTEAFLSQSANPQLRIAEAISMTPEVTAFEAATARAAGVKPQELLISANAPEIKKRLAEQKYDTNAVNEVIFGTGKTARGGRKTSNNSLLTTDRPDANIIRRNNGLGGNEQFAQDTLGKWVQTLRSNNPRRRR